MDHQPDFLDVTGATRLNLVSTAADLTLGGNYVNADTEFNATMTQSRTTLVTESGTDVDF
jgi:hypothetical protein